MNGAMAHDPQATPFRAEPASPGLEETAQSGGARLPDTSGQRLGRFVLIQKVGEGGMGAVYAAHDPMLNRKVAIKLLRRELSAQAYGARLMREAQSLAKLSHPNVVNVHDVGEADGQMFLAMEHIDGSALSEVLRDGLPWHRVLALFLEAGRGLAAAHAAGLIHRDFKPQNAMLGVDGRVRVLDFGLARDATEQLEAGTREGFGAVLSPLTKTGAVMGTPLYMSPEQFQSLPCDARTDQFSFCVAVWEGLYGQRPFAGDDLPTLQRSVLSGNLVPAPRGKSVPPSVHAALIRGLSVQRENRFPSMDALLEALTPRSRRWSRSWVFALAAVAVVIGALAVLKGARSRTPEAWFEDNRRFCNPLQVIGAMKGSPPPEGPLGAAFQAGCLALAGRVTEADAIITAMPQQADRETAARILYVLGDPKEHGTDDYAAGVPLFALALKHSPNDYQLAYFLGFGELRQGKVQEAQQHLEYFLELFEGKHGKGPDPYRQSAIDALEQLKQNQPL